jgi:site-specific DNA-cytosine methylase
LYDVIGDISEDSTLHSSLAVQSPLSSEVTKRAKTGYDPSDYVVPCITTNGGKGYHWSGRRFTIRELATLQQFPPKYRFIRNNRNIMKQIGNAIPPLVWEKFIREIMKTVYDYKAGRISDY